MSLAVDYLTDVTTLTVKMTSIRSGKFRCYFENIRITIGSLEADKS